jgi:hypothetical protein
MPNRKSRHGRSTPTAQKEQLLVDLDSPSSKLSSLPSSIPEDAPIHDLLPEATERPSGFEQFGGPQGLGVDGTAEDAPGSLGQALDALQLEPSPVAERMGGTPWSVEEDLTGAVGHTRSPVIAP